MNKIKKTVIMLVSLSLVIIIGFTSYNYFGRQKGTFGVEELANYDVNTAEKSAFELYTESLEKLDREIRQELNNGLELTMQFESMGTNYRESKEGDGTICRGANWQKIKLKNTSETRIVINKEAFYYYIDEENRNFPTNVLENEKWGKYSFDSFPVVLDQGQEKELILAFEYDFLGKRYPADSTPEQRSAHIYERAFFFKLSDNALETKIEQMGLSLSCASTELEEKKLIG
ncbi:MAG: hypothetical protein ACRC6X_02960 [Culicoidibacterales bacterium]